MDKQPKDLAGFRASANRKTGRIAFTAQDPALTMKPNKEVPLALIPDKPENHTAQHLADNAFEAHAVLTRVELDNPRLAANPAWNALRDTAYARFRAAMEKA